MTKGYKKEILRLKKKLVYLLIMVILASVFVCPTFAQVEVDDGYDYTRFKDAEVVLNVFNWGEYIADGSDDSLDAIKEFEELTGIDVNYTLFETNESLYTKLKSGAANYDVIIPSDYMIGKLINEDMLLKLDMDNIPNISKIGKEYQSLSYDPNNEYSVPYSWGTVGIIYNTTMVDEVVDSWEIMWNEKYKGEILMFNNSRDAFAIALKKEGLSLNPSTQEELDIAKEALIEQKPLVQAYVMDEVFDKMIGGEAAIAPYYAGDAITMIADNPDLAFAIPKEGTNYFVDALCVPKDSQNKEAAEMFINFMCETQVALATTEYIGYSSPQVESIELLSDEMKNSPISYPSAEVLATTETFNVLPDEMNKAMDEAWSQVKSSSETGNSWILPIVLIFAILVVVFMYVRKKMKRDRSQY